MPARESEEARFTALVRAHQGQLLRMCCVWLRDPQTAEDAVQETFLKAWEALPRFRGTCSDRTWLTRIAVNTCRDIRRSGWRRHVDRRVTPEELPLAAEIPESEDGRLFRAVWALPDCLREVVLLYYYQDMNLTEVAKALSVSASTVSRRLRAAAEELRRRMGEEDAT